MAEDLDAQYDRLLDQQLESTSNAEWDQIEEQLTALDAKRQAAKASKPKPRTADAALAEADKRIAELRAAKAEALARQKMTLDQQRGADDEARVAAARAEAEAKALADAAELEERRKPFVEMDDAALAAEQLRLRVMAEELDEKIKNEYPVGTARREQAEQDMRAARMSAAAHAAELEVRSQERQAAALRQHWIDTKVERETPARWTQAWDRAAREIELAGGEQWEVERYRSKGLEPPPADWAERVRAEVTEEVYSEITERLQEQAIPNPLIENWFERTKV